jgi:hypothetical protein
MVEGTGEAIALGAHRETALALNATRIDSDERTPERGPVGGVKRYVASAKRTPW